MVDYQSIDAETFPESEWQSSSGMLSSTPLPYCGGCNEGWTFTERDNETAQTAKRCNVCHPLRRKLKNLERARLPFTAHQHTLSKYEWDTDNQRERVGAVLDWIHGRTDPVDKPSVLMYGRPGNGKSSMLHILAKHAVFAGKRALYITHEGHLMDLKASFNQERRLQLHEMLEGVDLLCFDEIGGMGGGGGAGGYRNSYASETSGGNSSTETPISISPGTQYTITVGAGGSPNAKGGDSTFATITSVGGGRGPAKNTASSALNGGSGGGGPRDGGPGGSGTTGQGFAGGFTGYGAWQGASGGGGAGQVGQVGASNGSPQGEIAGNGGNGLSSSITGSAVTRAGGGGGYNSGAGAGGNGGAGGGGNGGWRAAYAGSGRGSTPGSVNTGSGGGGNQNSASSGGSGVVILRMATANYSGITTGSPTVTTVGSDTVLVFNSSGSYTA